MLLPDPIDAVLCDMDGLLLDTEAAHIKAMTATVAELGLDVPEGLFLRVVGVDRVHARAIIDGATAPDFPIDLFYADSDLRFAESAIAKRPGVDALLSALDALGLRRAVVTSTARDKAHARLAAAGILTAFDTIVTVDDVLNPKPAPDPYLLAAERLGARPAHCLALEDSHNGVRAAAAAGCRTIMVPDLLPPTDETHALVAATMPSLDAVAALLLAAPRPRSSIADTTMDASGRPRA